jgi:1,4-dihydroxy-2-naphthoate octaprenyltransferase
MVLLINEFADKEADQETGRRTWVILFGERVSLYIYLFLAFSCYAVVVLGIVFGKWPLWSLLVFITFPMAVMSFLTAMKSLGKWPKFLGAVKSTILVNFLFLVLLSISFLI